MTYTTSTTSSEETRRLGARMAHLLKGGVVIELIGDLGSGKTTFTQGLLEGLGYKDEVTSPSFTVSREYETPSTKVYHFDLYRLAGHDIATEELTEVMEDKTAVTVVEWPGNGDAKLPSSRIRITLAYTETETDRELTFEGLGELADVIKEMKHADSR